MKSLNSYTELIYNHYLLIFFHFNNVNSTYCVRKSRFSGGCSLELSFMSASNVIKYFADIKVV